MTEKKPSSIPTGPMLYALNLEGRLRLRDEPGERISMNEARVVLDEVLGPRKPRLVKH